MPKRFNNLKAALRSLRTPGAAPGSPIPDAPAGTILFKYQEYSKGAQITYTRNQNSLPQSLNLVKIQPFGYPAADTTEVLTTVSNRSAGQYATVGLSTTILGIENLAANDTAIELPGFRAAKATARNVVGTTASVRTSQITGVAYKSKQTNSYTYPVGRTTANPSFSEQKAAIIAAVESSGNRSVSFTPEKF